MPRVRPVNTAEAMRIAGITNPATFRKAMARERAKKRDYQLPKDQWDDQRTPKWDGAAIESWAKGRKP
jgi:hypothetical protein